MASRGGGLSIDRNILDVCGCSGWYRLLNGFGVVVDSGDCCADVEEGIVDRIFRSEGRKNEILRRGRDCRPLDQSMYQGQEINISLPG